LFDGKTRVFVKYVAHNATKLTRKHKVVFYASQGLKQLVGEGVIEKVEFLTPDAILMKYKESLFLDANELYAYVEGSPSRTSSKKMLTIVLKKLNKYPTPIDYNRSMTMAGQYLEASEYNSLIDKRKRRNS
jgi:hypothetical protein